MLTVTPFLWFDAQAEDAMNLYVSIFPRSKVLSVNRAQGKVMSVQFELEGQKIFGMNGRPPFEFNDSFSFLVSCESQQEIDDLWAKLTTDGGAPGRCGWLKDKFGLSWQIIPSSLGSLMSGGGDPTRAKRVMEAFFQMNKIDVSRLHEAHDAV